MMEFWNFRRLNLLWWLASEFVTSFRTTFIFGESQFKLSIKSYDRLKFFRPKFFKS